MVHQKNIGAVYWQENAGELTLPGLCSYESSFFFVNPETLSSGTDVNTVALLHLNGDLTDETGNFVPVIEDLSGGASTPNYATGVFGQGFETAGDRKIILPYSPLLDFLDTSDFTIDCRFKLQSMTGPGFNSAQQMIFSRWDFNSGGIGEGNLVCSVESTGRIYVFIVTSLDPLEGITLESPTGTVTSGVFYHVALTRSGDTLKLFLDGTEIDTVEVVTPFTPTTMPFSVGADAAENNIPAAGIFDEVRISNVARWSTNFTVPASPYDLSGSSKESVLSAETLNADFKFITSSDIVVPVAADYADTNWLAKGWTTGNETTFVTELKEFVSANYSQSSINPALWDNVMCLTRGTIGGVAYTIPFIFFGNIGDNLNDSFTSLKLHLDGTPNDVSDFNHTSTVFPTVSYVAGRFGNAADFSNSGSRITYETGSPGGELDFGSGDFTLECWLRALGTSGPTGANQHFMNRWLIAGGDWYCVLLAGSNTLRIGITGFGTLDGGSIPVDGNFHHVAYVRSGTALSIYVDGTRVALGTLNIAMPFTPTTKVGIGAISNGASIDKFGGYIDEVRWSKGIARYTGTSFVVPTASF